MHTNVVIAIAERFIMQNFSVYLWHVSRILTRGKEPAKITGTNVSLYW